jgi:CubicO group peptidase (beta-lactamase class C family)
MNLDQGRIDQIFAEWNNEQGPGCTLGIYKDGEVAYARGYGMANLEHGIPNQPGSIFHVASVSKHFATFAIGLLEEEGKLSVDDEARKYVPSLPDFGVPVTIRQLIHHTSGIRDQWALLHYSGWRTEDLVSEQDVMTLLERQRDLNFPPGTKHLYSNSGYTLLAVIVQAITGQTLRQFTHERIFAPLGMTSTHFHDDHTEIVPGRTQAYLPREGGGYRINIPEFALAGATSLFTTVEDLAKWERNFTTAQVGSPALIAKMQESTTLSDGSELPYGWALANRRYRGALVVEHAGADHGYRAHFLRLPDYGIAVSCLANLSTITPSTLCDRVVDVLLGDQLDTATTPADASQPIQEPTPADFTGFFREPKDGSLMAIEVRDGRLLLDLDEERALLPGENGQLVPDAPWAMTLTAVAADDERPAGIDIAFGAGRPPIRFDRFTPAQPGDLSAYAGRYWSDELSCFYDIVLDGDTLALDRFKCDRRRLHPGGPDQFFQGLFMDTLNLSFERDDRGEVTGFTHSDGRIRGLRFRKVPAGTP